jgi:hypothetical protein
MPIRLIIPIAIGVAAVVAAAAAGRSRRQSTAERPADDDERRRRNFETGMNIAADNARNAARTANDAALRNLNNIINNPPKFPR